MFETLAGLATRRPVAICVVAVAIALVGSLALQQLPIDLLPDLQSPTIVVSVSAGDRPPVEMERLYGERVEQQLFTVRGIKAIEQVARSGRLIATVFFEWDADLDIALIDVQKALGSIEGDPEVNELIVRRFDPRQDPILMMGLRAPTGTPDLIELRQIAKRQIATALETLPGVAEAMVTGGRKREIRVIPDPYRMNAFNISLEAMAGRIQSENIDIQAGTIEEQSRVFLVRGRARFNNAQDVAEVVVRYIGEGNEGRTAVRVKDVAEVVEAEQEIDHVVLVNGQEGVGLAIYKEAGANTVTVSETIREALQNLKEDLPGVDLYEITDNAKLVVDALEDLQLAAGAGIVLAILVLALFLRSAGATLIVSAAVPVSILTALFFMHFGEYSLNIVTLGGLALGAGMLVDNAIVVVESMYRRVKAGDTPAVAARRGTAQVAGAITASTLTTCVVFLPVFFVQGLAARIIDGIAFTVVVSLLASLAVAVFLIPALGRWFLPQPKLTDDGTVAEEKIPMARRGTEWLVGVFLKVPSVVVVVAIGIISYAVYSLYNLGTELLPPSDPKQFSLRLVGPSGQRVESTAQALRGVESLIREGSQDMVEATLSEVGRLPDEDRIIRQELSEENTGRLTVRVAQDGPTGRAFATHLSEELEALPGTEITWEINRSALSEALGTGDTPILVEVSGNVIEDLEHVTETVRGKMAELPELWNVQSSFEGGPPELRIELDRAMADALGVNLNTVARTLEAHLDGRRVTMLAVGDEEYPVVLRQKTPRREDLGDVEFLTPSGRKVAVAEVATFEITTGAREIYRRDQRRTAQVTAQIADGFEQPHAVAAVNEVLADVALPSGIDTELRGEEEERVRTFGELRLAAILALVLVLMVLAGSFESMLQPITVLFAIPLASIGVAIALVPFANPIGIMAMLGLIVLAGVAVNDAVLLLVTARQHMDSGIERIEALKQAAGVRLRPITMTTLTTALALFPLLFGGGEGAVLRQPMALTIIGGLVTSTIGSLFVLPCLYLIMDNLGRLFKRKEKPVEASSLA